MKILFIQFIWLPISHTWLGAAYNKRSKQCIEKYSIALACLVLTIHKLNLCAFLCWQRYRSACMLLVSMSRCYVYSHARYSFGIKAQQVGHMTIPFPLASYLLVCNLYTKQGAAVPLVSMEMQQGLSFVSFCAGRRKMTKTMSFILCSEIGALEDFVFPLAVSALREIVIIYVLDN